MKHLIGMLAVSAISGAAYASTPLPACAPADDLSVGGITFFDNRDSVLSKLGQPDKSGTYQREDDGGAYTGSTLIYTQLELDVDELRGVERIESKDESAKIPFGLKQGMTLDKVAATLRFIPVGLRSDSVAVLPVCGALYDSEVRLHFSGGKLRNVEITQYGP